MNSMAVLRVPYESVQYLSEYLLLHYARPHLVFPYSLLTHKLFDFHERLRREFLLPIPDRRGTRALDLGCAVGRFTFELGLGVEEVVGIDSSRRFIRAARKMARDQELLVRFKESGGDFTEQTVRLPKHLRGARVEFRVGDAAQLSAFPDGGFQAVAAVNLICRLPRPRQFLVEAQRLVAPGGQLLVASPFSWLRQHTPPREWMSSRAVAELFRPHFRLVREGDLPFLLREHRRKYELVISHALLFQRRSRDEQKHRGVYPAAS